MWREYTDDIGNRKVLGICGEERRAEGLQRRGREQRGHRVRLEPSNRGNGAFAGRPEESDFM